MEEFKVFFNDFTIISMVVSGLAVILCIVFVGQFGNYLRRKTFQKSLMNASVRLMSGDRMYLSDTSEERNYLFGMMILDESNEKQLAHLSRFRIMKAAKEGKEIPKKEVQHLFESDLLCEISEEGSALYPDAAYELLDTKRVRVFFRKDLTFVGYKDYRADIEEVLLHAQEQKKLLPAGVQFLRRLDCLKEENKYDNTHYGSFRVPYPAAQYYVLASVHGEEVEFCFDNNYALVVVMKLIDENKNVIIWELAGARQTELYHWVSPWEKEETPVHS